MRTLKDELNPEQVETMARMARTATGDAADTTAAQEGEHAVTYRPCDSSAVTYRPCDTSVEKTDNVEYGESIEEALARILQTCNSFEEISRAVDDALEAAIVRRERGREQLVFLFAKQDQLQAMMEETEQKLARAQSYRLNDFVASYSKSLKEAREALVLCERNITKMEADHPEVASELKEERNVCRVAGNLLVLLAQDDEERYIAEGTPQPSSAEAREWFEARMREMVAAKVVCAPIAEEKAVLQSASGSWMPRLASAQAVEAYTALLTYQRAIQKVERAKSREWINGLIKSGYLIPPDEAERQKRDHRSGAHRTILDLLEQRRGYCYIWAYSNSNKKTRVEPYASLRHPEAKIEYVEGNGTGTKHTIRITGVTAPHLVEDFFKRGVQTFRFDNVYELAKRRDVAAIVRTALGGALRYAEERRISDEEINDIRIGDAVELADLADGKSGTAVVFIPGHVCMQLVSDGEEIVAGKMTERSKESWLYEAIKRGTAVKTFLARNAAGEFADPYLQKLAMENEVSEVSQRVSLAHAEHMAASDNVMHLVMPTDQGGRDGAYVFKAVLYGRKERGMKVEPDRHVGYVVRRAEDSVEFMEGLSRFSCRRFEASGLKFGTSYDLVGGLNDYGLLLFRGLYCAVTRTLREKAPEHLRDGFRTPEPTPPSVE